MSLPSRPLTLLLAAALAVASAVGCTSLDEWQRQAIFSPMRDSPRWSSDPLPGTEQYDVTVENDQTLHFWYVPQKRSADAPTVLYLHGARWNLNGSAFRIARWHELGFNVLAVDYRGFGKSSDLLPSEATAREDTRSAFDELRRREPDPARRFIYGHSLGGALAIDLASGLQPPDQVAGIVVESTFTSIPDIVREMRWGWIPGLGLVVTQPFDSVSKINRVKTPLLIFHGTADSYVPHTMADELYRRAGSSNKQLVKIEGGGHSSGMRVGAESYQKAVDRFVASISPSAAEAAAAAAAGTVNHID